MLEFFNLLLSLFGDFIGFLDSFYIIGSLSFLKLFMILIIFSIAFKLLFDSKKE